MDNPYCSCKANIFFSQGKTVLLPVHALSFLKHADHIISLNNQVQ